MDEVIKAFLVSIGFAADESSARKTEERIRGVEDTARKSDQARTKLSGEAAMERARQALKEAGIHNASIAQIMAKRDEMAKADKEHEKRQKEYEARQAKARANTIAGMRTLANTAAATAVAIEGFTVALSGYAMHVAAKLEEMAYASDRTKSSVQDLKVFSQAVSQLGGSAGGALNDLESFAGRLRSNPQGYTAFLKSVGVEARDAQGNIRGAADLYKEFRKNVGERKSYEQQLLYAQEMGVSEQTWRATDPAKLAEEEARSRAKYARLGYDPDKAAEDAKQLQRVLRDMFESINIIGEKTASKIFKDLGGNLREFTTFIEQHGDQIAEILSKVAQVVLEVSKALLQLLTSPEVKQGFDWLLGMFGHVEEGTGKWIADTEKIKDALEALSVFVATIFVAKITGAFATILKELGPLMVRLAPLLALMGVAGYANSNGILTGPEGSRSVGEGALRTLDPGLADRVYGKTESDKAADAKDDRTWWQRNMPKALGGKDAPSGGVGASSSPAESDADVTVHGHRYRPEAGTSAGKARVASWLKFFQAPVADGGLGTDAETARAMVAMMQGESSADLNPVSKGDYRNGQPTAFGTAQWRKERFEALKVMANRMGTDWTDVGAQQQHFRNEVLNGKYRGVWARIKAAQTGEAKLKAGIEGFEVPADPEGAYAFRRPYLQRLRRNATDPSGPSAPSAQPTAKLGWIDANTYTDGLNTFKKGDDGNLKRVTNIPGQPATLADKAREFAEKAAEGVSRLDQGKLRAIGAATEGFNPSEYFKSAPPVGTTNTSNDNSVRHQSYNRGDTNVNIYTQADARETHDLWKRHEDRQKADDLRHASNIFAA